MSHEAFDFAEDDLTQAFVTHIYWQKNEKKNVSVGLFKVQQPELRCAYRSVLFETRVKCGGLKQSVSF